MSPTKLRALFIASSLLILALALAFGAILSTGSFTRSLTESYASSYVLNGGESVRKIEYALKYGKQLDNFFGIQTILQEVQANNEEVKDVKVLLADGKVAYSLAPVQSGQVVTGPLGAELKQLMRPGAKNASWIVVNHQYNTLVVIRDPSGKPIGAMDLVFSESVIAPHANAFENSILNQTVLVGAVAAMVLLITLASMQIVDPGTSELRTRRLLTVVLLVIGVAQAVLTTQAILKFQPVYLESVHRNHALVGELVRKNIDTVIGKGVQYGQMEQVDTWMDSIPRAMPEIEGIVLVSDGTGALYSTHRADSVDNARYVAGLNLKDTAFVPLLSDSTGTHVKAVIALSRSYIESKSRTIIIDAVTLLVTTILFAVEIVLFLGIFFHRQAVAHAAGSRSVSAAEDTAIVRPQAFLFFLAASMAASFLPVVLKNFEPILGLPENIFLGLPLTVELMASIASTLVTGVILDRSGWRPPFLAGLLVVAAGTLLSAIAPTTVPFLMARLVVGVGYGFAWMSLRGFVANGSTQASQATGFAGLNSGIYAGINCGVVVGALLLDRLSYSGIFWTSLALVGVAIAFCLAFTTNQTPVSSSKAVQSAGSASELISDSRVQVFFLTVAIPTAICLMFLNYMVPVYAKTIGISAGDVGRLFLLYGLCVVYLGPVLSRTLIAKYSAKTSTGFSFLLIIAGLLLFGFFPSPLTCTIAVLTLGLSDGIGLVARNNYFLAFPTVKRFGVGKSMGVFSIVTKLGQTAGPIIFGWLSLVYFGVGMLGIAFAVALLVFMFLAKFPKTDANP
jgi:predicted MFS family arabinose efflux permease